MALKIGFARQFFTLWDVSEPYRHYTSEYNWEYRVNFTYLRNLSKDEEKAKIKAKGFGVKDLEVDRELFGRNSSFYTTGRKGTDRPDWEYPAKMHRHGYGDIREMGTELHSDARAVREQAELEVKALWTLYLKKDIVFHDANPVRPEWKRPIVYARMQLAKLGIIIKYNGEWMTPKVAEMRQERDRIQAQKDAAKTGHFFNEKDRVELTITEIDSFDFMGQFGICYIKTYKDDQGRLFNYMGGSPKEFEGTVKVKATIKHSEYKGEPQTHLQRMKVL